VDVIVSEDQRILQDSTRRYLEDRSPIGALRQLADNRTAFSDSAWREGVEQGWVSLFVPEAHGGIAESAQGVIDAAIVAEEQGRVVYAGPFLSNCVVAFAIAKSGSEAQQAALLPALAAGTETAAWCFAAAGVNGGATVGGVRVKRAGDAYTLDGIASNVQDAQVANHLLVSAVDEQSRVTQFLIPANFAGITITLLETLDLGRRLANVQFTNVKVSADALLGESGNAADAFEHQLQVALVLQSAETVGVIDRALQFTLDFVQQRFAFGRPIGSFQSLKHRLADHATQLEGAKAAVAHAAIAVQKRAVDAAIAVSVAKSQSSRFATEIIRDCLHMHGGIGMTWEHDIHFYLRRAVSNEALWGTPAVHHERLCKLAGI
jgi:alkylation response protein AidB-like acyl-CoA dehydrogenase